MKKILLLSLLIAPLLLTGCTEELENVSNTLEDTSNKIDDTQYAYPDSKDVLVTLAEYNELQSGMTEQEVWDIIGGQCTNTGTTDLGIGEEYITVSYGCNGDGTIGANVVLMFQGGKLNTKSQIGLR